MVERLYQKARRYILPPLVVDEGDNNLIEREIKAILERRALLREEDGNLLNEINTYRVTEWDVNTPNNDMVAVLANLTEGPVLMRVKSKDNGYGLFAERDYAGPNRSNVTRYQGKQWLSKYYRAVKNRDYIVDTQHGYSIDGRYGFLLSEKGRWVNEPNLPAGWAVRDLITLQNIELDRNNLYFFPLKNIPRGTELTWYYGPAYHRHWLN
jgi:hypothetical protein